MGTAKSHPLVRGRYRIWINYSAQLSYPLPLYVSTRNRMYLLLRYIRGLLHAIGLY
jgi:hypothetical protein